MSRKISVNGKTTLEMPVKKALAIIRKLQFLELYEPKVDSAQVKAATEMTGFYRATGHFAGLPWGGKFFYELEEDGFRSQMLGGSLGIKVMGGFRVKPESDASCVITHYERYEFPSWLSPFIFLIRSYLRRAMKEELRNLVKLIYQAFRSRAKPEEGISVSVA